LLVGLLVACTEDNPPNPTGGTGGSGGTGGAGGAPAQDSGGSGGAGASDSGGGTSDTVTPPPPGDGGLVPCLDRPNELDRPPSGQLPCDLLPPGFVAH
jgi:hypothetical protein